MKIKVIIADDEERICRLIQMLVDWESLGMEVVGTASNGLEALELIEALSPDILITDIRMPGCDGIELIEKARAIAPELEVTIISGYAQFEYAQTAIRCGVGEYLLKPINKDELTATLQKLGESVRRKAAADTTNINMQLGGDRDEGHRRQLIDDLLSMKEISLNWESLQNDYGFPAHAGMLRAFILKMDYDPEKFSDSSRDIVRQKSSEIFKSGLDSICICSALKFKRGAGYGVINYSPDNENNLRKTLRKSLNQLEAQKFFFGYVEFTLALGSPVDDPAKLSESLNEAIAIIAERLIDGTGRLYETAPKPSGINTLAILDRYSRDIGAAAEALIADNADKALERLRGELTNSGVSGLEFLEIILSAGRIMTAMINVEEQDKLMEEFAYQCEQCSSGEKLFKCLRDFQRLHIELARKRMESEAIRPVRIAKDYIHQHYREPITLENVCDATGFSVSYFSTLFKKETGEGFSKYLTRVRIDHAKTLLQDTNLPVSEVCLEVGYNDIKHFNSTFKKITSLSPGQYRKLYG